MENEVAVARGLNVAHCTLDVRRRSSQAALAVGPWWRTHWPGLLLDLGAQLDLGLSTDAGHWAPGPRSNRGGAAALTQALRVSAGSPFIALSSVVQTWPKQARPGLQSARSQLSSSSRRTSPASTSADNRFSRAWRLHAEPGTRDEPPRTGSAYRSRCFFRSDHSPQWRTSRARWRSSQEKQR